MSYPKTLIQFDEAFPNEESCYTYLEKIRWNSFSCLKCSGATFWPMNKGVRRCARCKYESSVLAGTIFQDTHLSLKTWFYAIWWISAQKTGVSALGLQRILGLGSYKTAWLLLHKIRKAMVQSDRHLLSGNVEIDETFLGGFGKGKAGRGTETKKLLVIAVEFTGKKMGRIRINQIPDATNESLRAFIIANVELNSYIHTDGWMGYSGLAKLNYKHQPVRSASVTPDELTPRVHRVASLLKRWILGTHHGRYEQKYLKQYLEEFVFRFNRRTSLSRGLLFQRIIENGLKIKPNTRASLVSK